MDFHKKTMHLEVSGCVGQRGFAKIKHRLDLSMDIKMYGLPEENPAFGGQRVCGAARIRKKLSIDW